MISESAPSIIPPFSFQPSTAKPLTLPAFLFCSCWRQRKRYGGSHWPPRTDPSPRVCRQSGQLGGSPAALSPFRRLFTAETHFEVRRQMFSSINIPDLERAIKEPIVATGSRIFSIQFEYLKFMRDFRRLSSHLYCFCFRRKSHTWKRMVQIYLRPTALKSKKHFFLRIIFTHLQFLPTRKPEWICRYTNIFKLYCRNNSFSEVRMFFNLIQVRMSWFSKGF